MYMKNTPGFVIKPRQKKTEEEWEGGVERE